MDIEKVFFAIIKKADRPALVLIIVGLLLVLLLQIFKSNDPLLAMFQLVGGMLFILGFGLFVLDYYSKKDESHIKFVTEGSSNRKVHYERLRDALKKKKLVIFQYSCTDLNKIPIEITSAFATDYFTDQEFPFKKDDDMFQQKMTDFFYEHKEYYFLFWNFNHAYSVEKLGLRLPTKELNKLVQRCIDFDSALNAYAIENGVRYIEKLKGGFDTRYYFALLNELSVPDSYIWGGFEPRIKDSKVLLDSSRAKVNIMSDLLDKFVKKELKLGHDEKIIEKSKSIMKVSK